MMGIRKIKIIFYAFPVLACMISAIACAAEIIQVKPSSPEVSIKLLANPSTGYQWVLIKYDQTLMEKPIDRYLPPDTQLIGTPGYTVWQFKFKSSAFTARQKTQVILEYKRPWEKTKGQEKVISFMIQSE